MSYTRDESRVDPDAARADEQAQWQRERKQSLREQYVALATVIDARFSDHNSPHDTPAMRDAFLAYVIERNVGWLDVGVAVGAFLEGVAMVADAERDIAQKQARRIAARKVQP